MSKNIKNNYIPQYNLGGWFKDHPLDWARKNASVIGTTYGTVAGGIIGSVIPGAGTALGASIGGSLGGALGGAIQSNYDNNKAGEESTKLRLAQEKAMQPIIGGLSPKSMYGIYKKGGELEGEENPIINIEKDELAVQKPNTNSRLGKIVKEFTGINPLTGTNYEKHSTSKTKEPIGNYVPTEMVKDELQANYIISKKYAKAYKDATRRKDQFTINSIIRNIDAESQLGKDPRNKQMKNGGMIPKYDIGGVFANGLINPNIYAEQLPYSPFLSLADKRVTMADLAPRGSVMNTTPIITPGSVDNTKIGNTNLKMSNAGTNQIDPLVQNAALASIPGLINLSRGLFEKPVKNAKFNPIFNPYESQALGKFSGRISSQPALNEVTNQRNSVIQGLKSNSPNSSIFRSNLQNLFGNTAKTAGNIINQTKQANLGLDAQEGQALMNAGNSRVNSLMSNRDLNFQVDQMNLQNRAAKDNLLYAGLGDIPKQMLQLRQNQSLQDMEAFKAMMLMDTFGTSKDMLSQPKYAKYRKLLGI